MGNVALNIYKAFGIKKARNPYSVWVEQREYSPYTKGISGDFKKHFKTPRGAMAYAVKYARQRNTNHAYIKHPNGGVNLVSTYPKTGNLTLHHVTHGAIGGDINWKDYTPRIRQEKLVERDVDALNKMKHLHKNSLMSLGDTPMDINTVGLHDLPKELHTTDEARDFNKPL